MRPWPVAQPLLPLLLWQWLRLRQGGALQAAAGRSRQQARLPVCRGFSYAAMRSWPRGYVLVPQVVGRGRRFALQNGLFGAPIWAVSAGRSASAILPAGVCRRFLPRLWPSASVAMALRVVLGEVLASIWLWWINCLLWDEKLLPWGAIEVIMMRQGMLLRIKSQFLHCAVGIIMYLCPR